VANSQRLSDVVGIPVDVPISRGWEEVGPQKALQEQESQNGAARGNDKNVYQIELP
jgi:hypothetical protein